MLKTKFDIQDLTRAAGHVARLVPAEDLFSLLARSITIPAGWIALATRSELDPLLLLSGQRCDAQNLLDVLFVRAGRLECSAQHETLVSSDGFTCLGRITVFVRLLTEPAELCAFRKAFLGSNGSVSRSGLDRFLQSNLHKALSELAEQHTAAELLAGLDATAVGAVVDRRVGPACLTAGLALDGPALVSFESPAWQEHYRQQTQLEQRRRHTESRAQIQEAVAAAQRQQLDHLLTIVKSLSQAVDGRSVSLPEMLTGFSDAERGQLYAALWHLPAGHAARYVVAVSGQEVLLFEPAGLQKPARRLRLSETLGPLRSVTPWHGCSGRDQLFIGAARGIHQIDLGTGETVRSFHASADTARSPQGGFNAIAATETHVFATHSELGLMDWRFSDEPDVPARNLFESLTHTAGTIRCARVCEGHLWFTSDACLWAAALDSLQTAQPVLYRCGSAILSAVCFDLGTVYAGDASGTIRAWRIGEPDSMRLVRNATGQPIESLQVLDTSGVSRLIIADRSSGLTAMVLGDHYSRRYEVSSTIVRRAAAAPDLLVAMNDARDRLIAWDPRRAEAPIASVVIPHLTGATLQDVAIVSGEMPNDETRVTNE